MIEKLNEIEGIISRLESLVKTLHSERDRAWEEVDSLKRALDERELELLQLDEEIKNEAKRFEEQTDAMRREKVDVTQKLGEVATRIRDLLSLLPESENTTGEKPTPIFEYSDNETQ